jgi:hypothetical protein
VFLATWLPGVGRPTSGSWAPAYRSPKLPRSTNIDFGTAPEVEPDFPTWYYDMLRNVDAVVLEEGVSGLLSPFAGNALLAVVCLGGELSNSKTAVFSWGLEPPLQVVVSDSGEVQALYGSQVLLSHQVFMPTTSRPLVIGAVILGRRLVMVVADGTVRSMVAALPREVAVATEAPLLLGQATIDNEVVYGDVSVLKLAMADADATTIVNMAADLAAEFGVEARP